MPTPEMTQSDTPTPPENDGDIGAQIDELIEQDVADHQQPHPCEILQQFLEPPHVQLRFLCHCHALSFAGTRLFRAEQVSRTRPCVSARFTQS